MKRIPGKKSNQKLLGFAFDVLTEAGLKKTEPRKAILSMLVAEHGPFTIEEIFKSVECAGLDLVTVYRCLPTFEKLGLVRRCDFGDGIARYEFQGDETHHHHHAICSSCKKTETLPCTKLHKLEAEIKRLGYTEIRHSLEFFGLCKECA